MESFGSQEISFNTGLSKEDPFLNIKTTNKISIMYYKYRLDLKCVTYLGYTFHNMEIYERDKLF